MLELKIWIFLLFISYILLQATENHTETLKPKVWQKNQKKPNKKKGANIKKKPKQQYNWKAQAAAAADKSVVKDESKEQVVLIVKTLTGCSSSGYANLFEKKPLNFLFKKQPEPFLYRLHIAEWLIGSLCPASVCVSVCVSCSHTFK